MGCALPQSTQIKITKHANKVKPKQSSQLHHIVQSLQQQQISRPNPIQTQLIEITHAKKSNEKTNQHQITIILEEFNSSINQNLNNLQIQQQKKVYKPIFKRVLKKNNINRSVIIPETKKEQRYHGRVNTEEPQYLDQYQQKKQQQIAIKLFPNQSQRKLVDLFIKILKQRGYKFTKGKIKSIYLIILKNMHDRGGLDLLDSQLNYKFKQLLLLNKQQVIWIVNFSPKCYLNSKTLKNNFINRLQKLGYPTEIQSWKYTYFLHVEYFFLFNSMNFKQENLLKQMIEALK